MGYLRPLFASFALTFCLLLGIFTLWQNPRSKLNRLFAFYNFGNALYNAADFVILIPQHSLALLYMRTADASAALIAPFLLHFVYELFGFTQDPNEKWKVKWAYILGGSFFLLHFSPFIIKDIKYIPFQPSLNIEIPGVLYPLFALIFLLILFWVLQPLPKLYRNSSGLRRKQIAYVFLASFCGIVAVSIYFVSLFSVDLPFFYYPLQMLVAYIFFYTIFKHSLIPVKVALRRTYLLIGVYISIGLILAPIVFFFHQMRLESAGLAPLVVLAGIITCLSSLGPFLYAHMVRRSSLFQDETATHLTHEFKTPLSAIQSAKMILEDELNQKEPDQQRVREYIGMIDRNVSRLDGFVRGILDLSKTSDLEKIDKENINLGDIVENAVGHFPSVRDRIRIHKSGDLTLFASPEGLMQIFNNLISNAAKFSPEGSIEVTLAEKPETLDIVVADHGAGIRSDNLEKIFDPYVKSSSGNERGSGLGLAIVKRWVDLHGGKVWAESAGPGQGASFYISLPK